MGCTPAAVKRREPESFLRQLAAAASAADAAGPRPARCGTPVVVSVRAQLETIVDANDYMTLATADAAGLPWATPVWYATADRREFLWASSPQARHSRNIAVRPAVAIVVFDSRQPPGGGPGGGGAYLSALAERVPQADLDRAVAAYSRVSEAKGIRASSRADVQAPARLRLYRAVAAERFVLSGLDTRISVDRG